MVRIARNLDDRYSPLYFLAALGAGGMAVTFFMIPMFWVPHPTTPIPTFESLAALFATGPLWLQAVTLLALAGVVIFAALHIALLAWNLREMARFRRTEGYRRLLDSNNEVQLMAQPLTLAMTINVGFILGALFVPGLWTVVEYLFPVAITGFIAVGAMAVRILTRMLSGVLVNGHFDCDRNNNLSQMLAIFALAMVAVGLAAPAAMSHVPLTSGIALILSVGVATVATLLAAIKLVLGFRAMMNHGVGRDGSVSLWIVIPILTLLGITVFRLQMALAHNFGAEISAPGQLVFLTMVLAIQLLFGWLGFVVMRQNGYFQAFLGGSEKAPGTLALVCPGVALVVFAHFFINKGLVPVDLLTPFGPAYFLLYLPVFYLQAKTIAVMMRLLTRLFVVEAAAPTGLAAAR